MPQDQETPLGLGENGKKNLGPPSADPPATSPEPEACGKNGKRVQDDIQKHPTVRPPGRQGHCLAYDPVRRRTVLFGGFQNNETPFLDDTWEWDGSSWQLRTPVTKPPGHADTWMFHVPALGGMVMFGGVSTISPHPYRLADDTWLWDGTDWKELHPGFPIFRFLYPVGAAYDSRRQRIRAFWPFESGRNTWDFFVDTLTADAQSLAPGRTVNFHVRLPGQAGMPFVLGLSTGTHPGIPVRAGPGGIEYLPLEPDRLLTLSLGFGLIRTLDAAGKATVSLPIPNDPALAWLRLYAAGLTFDTRQQAVGAVTQSLPLVVVP